MLVCEPTAAGADPGQPAGGLAALVVVHMRSGAAMLSKSKRRMCQIFGGHSTWQNFRPLVSTNWAARVIIRRYLLTLSLCNTGALA